MLAKLNENRQAAIAIAAAIILVAGVIVFMQFNPFQSAGPPPPAPNPATAASNYPGLDPENSGTATTGNQVTPSPSNELPKPMNAP